MLILITRGLLTVSTIQSIPLIPDEEKQQLIQTITTLLPSNIIFYPWLEDEQRYSLSFEETGFLLRDISLYEVIEILEKKILPAFPFKHQYLVRFPNKNWTCDVTVWRDLDYNREAGELEMYVSVPSHLRRTGYAIPMDRYYLQSEFKKILV